MPKPVARTLTAFVALLIAAVLVLLLWQELNNAVFGDPPRPTTHDNPDDVAHTTDTTIHIAGPLVVIRSSDRGPEAARRKTRDEHRWWL